MADDRPNASAVSSDHQMNMVRQDGARVELMNSLAAGLRKSFGNRQSLSPGQLNGRKTQSVLGLQSRSHVMRRAATLQDAWTFVAGP